MTHGQWHVRYNMQWSSNCWGFCRQIYSGTFHCPVQCIYLSQQKTDEVIWTCDTWIESPTPNIWAITPSSQNTHGAASGSLKEHHSSIHALAMGEIYSYQQQEWLELIEVEKKVLSILAFSATVQCYPGKEQESSSNAHVNTSMACQNFWGFSGLCSLKLLNCYMYITIIPYIVSSLVQILPFPNLL